MRCSSWSLLALLMLSACSSYAPPTDWHKLSRDELVARMGPPETVRTTATGTRLEFPRGPMGHHTWFVEVDSGGRIIKAEQVLTEPNFNRITPGLTQKEVRQVLGRPSEVQGLGRSRGQVWSYRYENPFCQWFQVELTREQQVRSSGYGQPPECEHNDNIILP